MEQELLILPEKMSSPKVLMGVHIAQSLVSCFLGGVGGQFPPFISVHFVDRYFSGQWNFEGTSCSKILLALLGQLIVFLKSPTDICKARYKCFKSGTDDM